MLLMHNNYDLTPLRTTTSVRDINTAVDFTY